MKHKTFTPQTRWCHQTVSAKKWCLKQPIALGFMLDPSWYIMYRPIVKTEGYSNLYIVISRHDMWYIELVQFGLNLPGGFNPSEKWWSSSVGIMTFPYIMENKIHVPKHQPETQKLIISQQTFHLGRHHVVPSQELFPHISIRLVPMLPQDKVQSTDPAGTVSRWYSWMVPFPPSHMGIYIYIIGSDPQKIYTCVYN